MATATRTRATRTTPAELPAWHEHPAGHLAPCSICEAQDRLELEQGQPVPEWARDGGGLLVRTDGTAIAVGRASARFPDRRPADHEPGIDCAPMRTAHVHYAREIAYPAGYYE